MLIYPAFDPVAVQLGPVAVHWYGLAYVLALLGGLWLAQRVRAVAPASPVTAQRLDDFLLWAVLGVVLGGRMGYALFYAPAGMLTNPLHLIAVWEGGMSFHGGLLGITLAIVWFCRKHKVPLADLADRIAPAVPLGTLLGRLANFINGELWGRAADPSLPWAMVFPHVDALPRHPSQLYQAGLEGLLLGAVMLASVLWQRRFGWRPWLNTGVFLVGYGVARLVGEHFRQFEIVHEWGWFSLTQGQLLSVPMVVAGLWCLWLAKRR